MRVVFCAPQAGHSTRQGFGPRFVGPATKLLFIIKTQLHAAGLTCLHKCGLQLLWLLLRLRLRNHNRRWSGSRSGSVCCYCHIVRWRRLNGHAELGSRQFVCWRRQRSAWRVEIHLWIEHGTLLFHGAKFSFNFNMNQILQRATNHSPKALFALLIAVSNLVVVARSDTLFTLSPWSFSFHFQHATEFKFSANQNSCQRSAESELES